MIVNKKLSKNNKLYSSTAEQLFVQLREGMSGLPQGDIKERLSFYSEMIDDRIEEGLSEEEAVREIGNVDEIISRIIADTPLAKLSTAEYETNEYEVKEKYRNNFFYLIWQGQYRQ